jgi:hypothetical protein
MKRLLIGIMIGMLLMATPLWALRTERPPEFYEWNTNTFTQLNNFLLQVWNVINGRYALDVTTADPDGSRRGVKGEMILYDPGASEELCVNIDGSTDWDCVSIT